jgi:hypothetical protein
LPEPSLPLVYRVHALQRMVERDIPEEAVAEVVSRGKVIESYPEDKPYPSRLLLGWVNKGQGARPIHVVSATTEHEIIIITVYEPDPAQWAPGFEKRKP